MKIASNGMITPTTFAIQQYNNNVDIKCFEIPRYYYGNTDGDMNVSELYDTNKVDLAQCKVVLRLTDPDDKIYQGNTLFLTNEVGENEISDEDDIVVVNWIVTDNVSDYAGKRTYQLEFHKEDDSIAFRTQIMNFVVNTSLETEENISKKMPNIVEQWEEELQDALDGIGGVEQYVDEASKSASEAKKSEDNAKISENNAKNINASMEQSKSELDKRIADVTEDNISSMAEVIDARSGFDNLGSRLDVKPYYFDNIESMKSSNLKSGDYVVTNGYYDNNDGGGATYRIRAKFDNDIDNGGSIHFLNNTNLVAELIVINSQINVKQFGAKGDGINPDSSYIQNAMNYVKSKGINRLIINNGIYLINVTLNVPSNIQLIGISKTSYLENISTIFVRKTNIKMLNLAGKDYSISNENDLRASDIRIENITLLSESEEYLSEPTLYTKRAIYNYFDRVMFKGNGKAIYMDKATFDSRFMNCDFVGNSGIETAATETDEYHDAVFYGVNQICYYGCRFESYTKGNLIKFKNNTREMFFFGCKFEGNPSDGNPILQCSGSTADIYMYGTRITMNSESNSYFADLSRCTRGNFEVSYVDNSQVINNPFIKISNCKVLKILFYPSFNKDIYTPSYYIENIGDNSGVIVEGSLTDYPYYSNSKKLFSDLTIMNKSNTIFSSSVENSDIPNAVYLNLKKSTDENFKRWAIKPMFYSFTDNIQQLCVVDPDGNKCGTYRNGGFLSNKRLSIPYLSEAPSTISNGDILINNYTNTAVPNLTIGANGTSKRIGWSDASPSSGYWLKGNIVYNNNPTSGGCMGWVCTATGTPGIWKSFGTINS